MAMASRRVAPFVRTLSRFFDAAALRSGSSGGGVVCEEGVCSPRAVAALRSEARRLLEEAAVAEGEDGEEWEEGEADEAGEKAAPGGAAPGGARRLAASAPASPASPDALPCLSPLMTLSDTRQSLTVH
jgi:hypothetical protein